MEVIYMTVKFDENREHCKRIALELEQWATGKMSRCPYCDEWHSFPDDVGDKFCCPDCHTVNDVHDWDVSGLWDYLDDILDINYLLESDRKTVRAVKILVAFGGPNIYIDTESKAVELYWWTDRASYPIDPDVVEALNEWAQELFEVG